MKDRELVKQRNIIPAEWTSEIENGLSFVLWNKKIQLVL